MYLYSQINVLLAYLICLKCKIKSQKLGGLPQKLGGLPQKLGGLPQKLGGLPQKLGGLPQKLGGLTFIYNNVSKCN